MWMDRARQRSRTKEGREEGTGRKGGGSEDIRKEVGRT